MSTPRITSTLQQLDAAPATSIDDVTRRRAEARLQQIIASPLQDTSPGQAPRRRRQLGWRVSLPTLAVAAAASLVVALGISEATPAYATWKPAPTVVTGAERDLAAGACESTSQRAQADVVLAERRGDWVAVALATEGPGTATCLVHLPKGQTQARKVLDVITEGRGSRPGLLKPTGSQFTYRVAVHNGHPDLFHLGAAPTASFVVGEVGPDVAAVRILTTEGPIGATVKGGHFFAWWPGNAFAKGSKLSYRLTLTDGTVIDDASPGGAH